MTMQRPRLPGGTLPARRLAFPQAAPQQERAESTWRRYISRPMINASGAAILLGSSVKFVTTAANDREVTTSTTLGDERICGIAAENIAVGAEGEVILIGVASRVRVAAGTTRGQFLRQSTTVGVMVGVANPMDGTELIALTTRDADGYCEALLMHQHVGNITQAITAITNYINVTNVTAPASPAAATDVRIYLDSNDGKLRVAKTGGVSMSLEDEYGDIVAPGAAQRTGWWDDFSGYRPGVTSFDKYVLSGAEFNNDTTTGRAYLLTGTETAASGVSYLALRGDTASISGGSKLRAAEKWWMKFHVLRQTAAVGGTQEYILGVLESVPAGDQPDGIFFRSVNDANWFLVCRNAGLESTVDMGVAPTSTLIQLEFRIASGASVQGYYNNTLTGVAITTNIPTNLQTGPFILHHNRAATVTTAGRISVYGMGMEGAMNATRTVATFNPNAHPETTSVDGVVDRTAVSGTWAAVRDGAGNAATDDATSFLLILEADTVLDRWFNMSRGIMLFDTSSIPAGAAIISARLRLYVETKADTNFSQSVNVVASTPASNTALVNADYGQLAATAFITAATIASLTTSAYNNLTLNATGLAAITRAGITKLGLRLSSDFNNVEPAWVNGGMANVRISTAEAVALQRPILEVTYDT